MKPLFKTIICTFTVSLLSFTIIAQQSPNEELIPKDPKAKAILEALSAKTKTNTSIQATFSYNLYNKDEKMDETQTGKILMAGEKYKLDIAGQQIISDGKTLWTYIKDAEEVQIDNVNTEENPDALSPNKIFTLYEEGFKYKYNGEETENGTTYELIKLFPIDANEKPFHTVVLKINKIKKELYSAQLFYKDGNRYTYTLTNFKANVPVSNTDFTFNETNHPNVDFIDLRD